jgi:hypothetical protein
LFPLLLFLAFQDNHIVFFVVFVAHCYRLKGEGGRQ